MAEEEQTYEVRVHRLRLTKVEVDTPGRLPEDHVCPVCGVGPDQFELVVGVARRHTTCSNT